MANRVFILPIRDDLSEMNLQVLDLIPNSSQKNSSYDGDGQTFYLKSIDQIGTTHMINNAYSSGSRQTTMIAFYEATVDDTTGGGNDVLATQNASLGLAAYLRERVQPGGIVLATAGRMTLAHANDQAAAIKASMANGGALTLAGINTILSNAAVGGVANTDLDGAAGASKSFGSVLEILRILNGEIYLSPMYTIIANAANQFRSLAERNVLVAAQDSTTTGQTFVSQGRFLASTENGYVRIPIIASTGALMASIGGGMLYEYSQFAVAFNNPNFAYAAADVTPYKPRAYTSSAIEIPATGIWPLVRVYDDTGVRLM